MDDPVAVALALAGRQLAHLRAGDFEAYEEAEQSYLAACRAVAESAAPTPGISRLVALVEHIATELGRLRGETGTAMSRLRATGTVAGAYLSTDDPHPTGGRSA